LLALEAREFLDRIVRDQLQARFIVEGFNFQFGRNREGNMDMLDKWCHAANVGLDLVPAFALPGDVPVSSSRVRFALNSGNVANAAELLGRPYRLRGKVVVGDRRGATLGFPTANLAECATVIPGDGVYAARAVTADQGAWPAAVNIGPNPTFGVTDRKIEAHLIGFGGDLYGQPLALDFVSRLRDTMTFASKNDLIAQLQDDAHRAANLASVEA